MIDRVMIHVPASWTGGRIRSTNPFIYVTCNAQSRNRFRPAFLIRRGESKSSNTTTFETLNVISTSLFTVIYPSLAFIDVKAIILTSRSGASRTCPSWTRLAIRSTFLVLILPSSTNLTIIRTIMFSIFIFSSWH